MLAALQGKYAVIEEARRSAPHNHVAMMQDIFRDWVGSLQPAELESRGQAELHRNNRLVEILFILVLMQ